MCDVGAGSPLQSLVTLVSWQQAQPTNPTIIREEQTSNSRQEKNQQTQQEAKQERGNKRHTKKHTGSEAGREGQRTNRNEGEDSRRRPAAAGQTRGGQGEAARTGGSSTGRGKGACSSSGVLRGDLDHLKVNTSVQEGRAPEKHSQHGVEGRAPHRAEAFVAMRRSEDRCQAVTTHHATGMTTGPPQIQPDTQREGPAEH